MYRFFFLDFGLAVGTHLSTNVFSVVLKAVYLSSIPRVGSVVMLQSVLLIRSFNLEKSALLKSRRGSFDSCLTV